MREELPLTITTSDRCPACAVTDITVHDGAAAVEPVSVQVWYCQKCGFAFYRYRRDDDADRPRRRRLPPIGGGAPAPPTWLFLPRRPADFVDDLLEIGAEVIRQVTSRRAGRRAAAPSRG
jgi:hypothetical protein